MNVKKRQKSKRKSGRALKNRTRKIGNSEKSEKTKIQNKEVYNLTMKEIDSLMKIGEGNLSNSQLKRLRSLAEAAERYEDTQDPLPMPNSLSDMIKLRMFQLNLRQQYTANLLGVSETKFSLILNGKQKPDVYFIKALHNKLSLDANQILEAL